MSQLSFIEAVKKGISDYPQTEHIGGAFFDWFDEDGTLGSCFIGFALLGAGIEPSITTSERATALFLFPELEDACSHANTAFSERIDEIIHWNDHAPTNDIQALIRRYETSFKKEARQEGARRESQPETVETAI